MGYLDSMWYTYSESDRKIIKKLFYIIRSNSILFIILNMNKKQTFENPLNIEGLEQNYENFGNFIFVQVDLLPQV